MGSWISHSNPARQTALSLGCILIGAVLAIGFRHADLAHMSKDAAGFLLGLLLLGIGVFAFLLKGRQTIVVDPNIRCITIEDTTQFGTKKRTIAFSDIHRVGVGYLGRAPNFVSFYYLVLHLNDGEKYPLFAPGRFYSGSSNRIVVASWQQRLEQYLNAPKN